MLKICQVAMMNTWMFPSKSLLLVGVYFGRICIVKLNQLQNYKPKQKRVDCIINIKMQTGFSKILVY